MLFTIYLFLFFVGRIETKVPAKGMLIVNFNKRFVKFIKLSKDICNNI